MRPTLTIGNMKVTNRALWISTPRGAARAPVLEELAKEYDGKIYIYKVDVDKEEELAATFGIRSIPTLLWIPKDSKPIVTQGAMPKTELKRMIEETLLKAKP